MAWPCRSAFFADTGCRPMMDRGTRRRIILVFNWIQTSANLYESVASLESPENAFGPIVNWIVRAKPIRLIEIDDSGIWKYQKRKTKPHNRWKHITGRPKIWLKPRRKNKTAEEMKRDIPFTYEESNEEKSDDTETTTTKQIKFIHASYHVRFDAERFNWKQKLHIRVWLQHIFMNEEKNLRSKMVELKLKLNRNDRFGVTHADDDAFCGQKCRKCLHLIPFFFHYVVIHWKRNERWRVIVELRWPPSSIAPAIFRRMHRSCLNIHTSNSSKSYHARCGPSVELVCIEC